jgi:A/G-specific adenine glycosylase
LNPIPRRLFTAPEKKTTGFAEVLLAWYSLHRRDLPWRADRDPYRVWISEVMLQQTRVAAVIEHYVEFLRRFPSVEKLAAARQATVLAAWSGLGYYRRARMMHAAAKMIVRKYGRKFPQSSKELENLPGIGRYTAAAIASIAFGEPVAVVDGNVERVLQRLVGKSLAGDEMWNRANEMLDPARPGDFNQAMMELGATVCTPRTPACLTCPIYEPCRTRGEFPPLRKAMPQKKCEVHYALDMRNGHSDTKEIFLVQRPRNASLMAGMWELQEITGKNGEGKAFLRLRHSITVTDYTVKVWNKAAVTSNPGKWIPVQRLNRIALTGLARKILRAASIL